MKTLEHLQLRIHRSSGRLCRVSRNAHHWKLYWFDTSEEINVNQAFLEKKTRPWWVQVGVALRKDKWGPDRGPVVVAQVHDHPQGGYMLQFRDSEGIRPDRRAYEPVVRGRYDSDGALQPRERGDEL